MAHRQKNVTRHERVMTPAQVLRVVRGQLEHKVNVVHTSAAASTGGDILYLSAIGQDDTISGRTGDKIQMVKLDIRIECKDTTSNATRWILFHDRQARNAVAGVSDVLSSATINAVLNPVSMANKRFVVLADYQIATSAAGEQYNIISKTLKSSMPIYYTSTGTTSASSGTNALCLLVITFAGTPTYDVTAAVTFTDA